MSSAVISFCCKVGYAIGLSAMFWCSLPVALADQPNGKGEVFQMDETVVSWCADFGTAVQKKLDGEDQSCVFDRLKKEFPSTKNHDLDASLEFYQALLFMMLGDQGAYEAAKSRLLKGEAFEPELFLYEARLLYSKSNPASTKSRMAAEDRYAEYCPLSLQGSDRDDRKAPAGKIDPPLPSVPKLRGLSEKMGEIGELYAKAGWLQEAVDANVEAIYAATPISPDSVLGQKWMLVAELERTRGQRQLSARAYLKAAFHDPTRAKAVAESITKAFCDCDLQSLLPARPKMDLKTTLAIARLYREQNLHPLSLNVLGAFQEEIGGNAILAEQRKEIEVEWTQIVQKHIRDRGDACVLLGKKALKSRNGGAILGACLPKHFGGQ